MTYGQVTSREPQLPRFARSIEPAIPEAVTRRFGELQSPGMGLRVQGQDLAEPGREMGVAKFARTVSPPSAQGAQERTFGAAGAASAGPAQEVAGNSFSHMSQQQRNDAGDAYRQAWQQEAPGGLRRANGPALDYYNAEQQVRGTGITAQRGANGVMEFSGDGSNALPQNYTQGVDLNLANERMARANAIRGETTAIRDGANFNAGGALSRQASQDETTRSLLTGPSRSGRQVAAQLIAGQQQNALNQQRMVTDADLSRQRLGLDAQRVGFDQQRLGMDQAEHSGKMTDAAFVRQARQGLLDTAGSTDQTAISRARAQAIAAGILKPESDAEQKVIYNEEALDPGNAMAGTRRVPLVLNRDGTATVVQPRTAPRGLPQGVSRDAALQSARRAIEMGYDRDAVMARLGEFGLSFGDLK
ncbi:hypothetical protein [Thauera sp. Sel9]|uniref:hypothetical protein n=1 Tax=Thauera sp. Sel9 TaxID=2974299 RepID=UPI0021E149DC|nr:hypothetical protein [Thauera sp. Sel9]